jgi:lysozyme family protein
MLLEKGNKGNHIKQLQACLKITVDGVFGNKTHASVKNGSNHLDYPKTE